MTLMNFALKVISYRLEVSFKPHESYMEGKAVVKLEGIKDKELVFYLHGELNVDSLDGGENVTGFNQEKVFYRRDYSLSATKVTVRTDKVAGKEKLEIYYSGFFNPSRARSPSDYMRVTANEVLLRSHGYSLWFPVFLGDNDDGYKTDFSKVTIKTPEELVSVFVGEKMDEYVKDGCRITQWQAQETDLFDAPCTAREYNVLTADNVFVYHLKDEESAKNAASVLEFARTVSASFRTHYKPDAEAKPSFVLQMPEYGDISGGNVTGINDDSWRNFAGNKNSQFLIAHELVHPYTRIDISQSNPLSALVIEGFPSYFFLPVLAEMWGEEWYDGYMERIEDHYLKLKETGKTPRGFPLPPEKPVLDIGYDEIGAYKDLFILNDRVLLFFNYLRSSMGKDKFYEFSKRLFELADIDYAKLEALILEYLPGAAKDIETWLKKTDYPAEFRLRS